MSLSVKTILAVLFCVAVGGFSGAFTVDAIKTWYAFLQKPSWNPPNYLFGPVWTVLYVMMGIAFARVWHLSPSSTKTVAMSVFALQFFLNFGWSLIFFYYRQMGWALVEICLMWLAIVTTIYYFSKLDKSAAYLLIPYICWVSFATFLNFTIWKLNS